VEIYLVIIIVLILLAVSDLTVGVANDAVNFLNSAIGSKVAPRHIIMIVAGLGIMVGTVFSSGIMEVARKGIFNPEMFYFQEVMIIFVAVMFTDVLLLDLYNTFGLPTSTTISLIFALTGGAVSVSLLKLVESGQDASGFINFLNTGQLLVIVSGILLSVIIAFSFGAIFQFFTRLIFTFDVQKRLKRYGALWGGVALSFITYFILIKGAKGVSFITDDTVLWIKNHTSFILFVSFAFWAIVFQGLIWFTKVNILKPVVLVGTFALALAFAANDLVNFIGVPLAGLSSFEIASNSSDPFGLLMEGLRDPVKSNTLYLLLAGVIMVITLVFSKKARSVTKTEVQLGRQAEGFERFESSAISRTIVRLNLNFSRVYNGLIPQPIRNKINDRFKETHQVPQDGNAPAFDLLRASVNLMVASIIISFATSLKLPLSTTYVTFMVAMGTSFSDKAWGRESAVYRVNGVLTVIVGWFLTAFIAFIVSGFIAVIIFYSSIYGIGVLLALAVFFFVRTHFIHKERSQDEDEMEKIYYGSINNGLDGTINGFSATRDFLNSVVDIIDESIDGLWQENRVLLKQSLKNSKKINKKARIITANMFRTIKILKEDELIKDKKYGRIINAIQEIAFNTKFIVQNCFDHIDNNHTKPYQDEYNSLKQLIDFLRKEINNAQKILDNKDFSLYEDLKISAQHFKEIVDNFDLAQLARIKGDRSSLRNSLLFIRISGYMENIAVHIQSLLNALKKTYESFHQDEIKKLESQQGLADTLKK
jgi:phosphate/sulfate permease